MDFERETGAIGGTTWFTSGSVTRAGKLGMKHPKLNRRLPLPAANRLVLPGIH